MQTFDQSKWQAKPVSQWTTEDVRAYAASIGLSAIDGQLLENQAVGES